MNDYLSDRLSQLTDQNGNYINSLREIIQEITLFALSKAGFFNEASFCGGTALRVFHGLRRASEDLDFALVRRNDNFSLASYFPDIERIFSKYNIKVSLSEKKQIGAIKSAFIKSDTITNYLKIESTNIDPRIIVKVKIEVDSNPPEFANYEYKQGIFPSPYKAKLMDLPSLFSGKLHAILCRDWVKGRDYFDFIFYLTKGVKPNLELLKSALAQTKYLKESDELNMHVLKQMLIRRFQEVDFEEAKKDCMPFINDISELDVWDTELFVGLVEQYL